MFHQAVNLRLPRCGRLALTQVPHMTGARRDQNIHLGVGVWIDPAQCQHRSFKIMGLKDAVQYGPKFQRHNLHPHPHLL
ncbi:MAG: hypothetical protein DMG67_18740 [Acidobacteria bacterium]|nr:MAG: hypothetical protein DMG67_18740 [Acidobacteriota bacterium]